MPKAGLTEILCVLDKSGSMQSKRNETIQGYNQFIDEQKSGAGERRVSLCLFDTVYRILYLGRPLHEVPALTEKDYVPHGTTALLDAVGRTIQEAGQRFSDLPEDEKPEHVVLFIATDGQENASVEISQPQLQEMIKHQVDTWQWKVVYFGQHADAFNQARQLGIDPNHRRCYAARVSKGARGAQGVYRAASYAVRSISDSGELDKEGTQSCLDDASSK